MEVPDEFVDSQDFNMNETSQEDFESGENRSINLHEAIEIDGSDDDIMVDDTNDGFVEDEAEDESNEDEEEAIDEIFQRKKRKESAVWKYGTRVKDGSRCNICGKIYKSKMGNTTNLISHIKHKHSDAAKDLIRELEKAKEEKKQKLAKKKGPNQIVKVLY